MRREILHLTLRQLVGSPRGENASQLKQRVPLGANACISQSGVNLSLPQSAVKIWRLSASWLQEPEAQDCPKHCSAPLQRQHTLKSSDAISEDHRQSSCVCTPRAMPQPLGSGR